MMDADKVAGLMSDQCPAIGIGLFTSEQQMRSEMEKEK
jgi:hypothetical protein